MLYNLKGTNTKADEHRSYIEKRIPALDKYFSSKSGVRLDIELEFMKDEERMFRAEGTLHNHGFNREFRVEERGSTPHEVIDLMVNSLNMELSREKKRIISDKRKGALRFKDFIRGFTDRT